MAELTSIVPIINDVAAIKILSLIENTQDATEISELLSLPQSVVEKKLRLINKLGLFSDGKLDLNAKNLVLATASAALKRAKK